MPFNCILTESFSLFVAYMQKLGLEKSIETGLSKFCFKTLKKVFKNQKRFTNILIRNSFLFKDGNLFVFKKFYNHFHYSNYFVATFHDAMSPCFSE